MHHACVKPVMPRIRPRQAAPQGSAYCAQEKVAAQADDFRRLDPWRLMLWAMVISVTCFPLTQASRHLVGQGNVAYSPFSADQISSIEDFEYSHTKSFHSNLVGTTDLKEIETKYNMLGHRFFQLSPQGFNHLFIQIDADNKPALTNSRLSNGTFFDISSKPSEQCKYLENVNSCTFLCVDHLAQIYLSRDGLRDASCRLEWNNEGFIGSKMHSNGTHQVMLVADPKTSASSPSRPSRLLAKWVSRTHLLSENIFVFVPVEFDSLLKAIHPAHLSKIYRTDVRNANYCQNLMLKKSSSITKTDADRFLTKFSKQFGRCSNRTSSEERSECRQKVIKRCKKWHNQQINVTWELRNIVCTHAGLSSDHDRKGKPIINCVNGSRFDRRHCRQQCKRRLRKEHPDWMPQKVKEKCQRKLRRNILVHKCILKANADQTKKRVSESRTRRKCLNKIRSATKHGQVLIQHPQ